MGCQNSCGCCGKLKQDPYWMKMCKILKLQYIILAGICLPLILIGSFAYLIPGFMYCQRYQHTEKQLLAGAQIENISITGGITTTIKSSVSTNLQQFVTDVVQEAALNQLILKPAKRSFPCSNAELSLNLRENQSLLITSDETSPVRMQLDAQRLDKFQYVVPHFSGILNVSDSEFGSLNITTESDTQIIGSNVTGLTSIQDSQQIALTNCFMPHQEVLTGGPYFYQQSASETNPVDVKINVTINSPNVRQKSQVVCLPEESFRGKCAQMQNRYWTGDVGAKLYKKNELVEYQLKGSTTKDNAFKAYEVNEVVRVCYMMTEPPAEFPAPDVYMMNRGSAVLILYDSESRPDVVCQNK